MSDIKKLSIKEFVEEGFLQEANRQFFHPLGVALSVNFDENEEPDSLASIWDYRDDPEGLFFDWDGLGYPEKTEIDKANKIASLRRSKESVRISKIGNVIQPVGQSASDGS